MSLSTGALKLQKWLERYKITATQLSTRVGTGPGKIRGSFGLFLAELVSNDLAAPATFTATAYDSNVVLTWADISSETNYKIDRSPNADFLPDTIVSATVAANATTYTDNTVVPGTGYHYKIQGTATGKDGVTKTLYTTTLTALLASASLTPSAITATTVTLTWAAVAGATGYVLERATAADFSTGLTTRYTGALLTFGDTSLSASTTYYYRVHATLSGFTTLTYATTSVATALAAPTLPVASGVTTTGMVLTWGSVTNATGYVLQRSLTGGSAFTTSTNIFTGAGTTFTDSGLTTGTTYYYRVYATGAGFPNSVVSSTCTQATS